MHWMPEPNQLLVAVVIAVGVGVTRELIRAREMRTPGTWPHIDRQLSRKQRASVLRALRNGQAADDPSLAFAVVAAARSARRHLPTSALRRGLVAVGVLLLAVGVVVGGWRAVMGPRDLVLLFFGVWPALDGLVLIAIGPASLHRAKRAVEAERANQALLDG